MSILSAHGWPGQCQTVNDVIENYLAQARRDLSWRSFETVACILGRFGAACGHLSLGECRPFDLQCWLNEQTQYRSEWYIRCVLSTIKRAFNWAVEMELVHRNPFAKMRSRGCLERRRPMTDVEFQTLLRGSDPTFRRLLLVLKFTGCRPGEATSMRWSEVRFEEESIVLRAHKTARKTGRPRVIPLVPTVIKLLVWMRSHCSQPSNPTCQNHVFTNGRGILEPATGEKVAATFGFDLGEDGRFEGDAFPGTYAFYLSTVEVERDDDDSKPVNQEESKKLKKSAQILKTYPAGYRAWKNIPEDHRVVVVPGHEIEVILSK
jgi:integrase